MIGPKPRVDGIPQLDGVRQLRDLLKSPDQADALLEKLEAQLKANDKKLKDLALGRSIAKVRDDAQAKQKEAESALSLAREEADGIIASARREAQRVEENAKAARTYYEAGKKEYDRLVKDKEAEVAQREKQLREGETLLANQRAELEKKVQGAEKSKAIYDEKLKRLRAAI